jgi:hypothetical protein
MRAKVYHLISHCFQRAFQSLFQYKRCVVCGNPDTHHAFSLFPPKQIAVVVDVEISEFFNVLSMAPIAAIVRSLLLMIRRGATDWTRCLVPTSDAAYFSGCQKEA